MTEVTDEALDAAAEELEEKPEETPEETLESQAEPEDKTEPEETPKEEKPKEDGTKKLSDLEAENQRLRSALGRLSSMQSKIDSLEAQLKAKISNEDEPEEENGKIIASEDDVLRVMRKAKENEQKEQNQYVEAARGALLDVGLQYEDLDDATYVQIHKDAEAHWKRVTGNPRQDAEYNFLSALNRHYKTKISESGKPKNPLDKNKEVKEEALGGPTETNVKPKSAKVPELDEYAKDFVKRRGIKPETIQKALTGDMPMYLRGGKF